MSDFLNNLVIRSFQPARAIQPLAASVFASAGNALGKSAFAAKPFDDPFTSAFENEQFVETPASGSHTIRRAPQKTLPTFSTDISVEDAQVAAPARSHTVEAESIGIKPATLPARIHATRQLLESDTPKPDRTVTVNQANVSSSPQAESLRPIVERNAGLPESNFNANQVELQPELVEPVVKLLTPLAAATPSASPRNEISALDWSLTPQPKQASLAIQSHLLPATEKVVIQQVTEIVEQGQLVSDAKMSETIQPTLIPKPISKPPIALNFNARSKPLTAQNPKQTEVAPPETVINVTIGRIEVRATASPATKSERQRSAPSAPSTMSLDEYLRNRNGGNR